MEATKICDVPFMAPANSLPQLMADPALGRNVLYMSFHRPGSMPDPGPALVRIDFERHEYRSFAQPAGNGSWQLTLCSDDKIWFGMNGPGQLACFDPVAEQFEEVPTYEPSRPTTHLTEIVEGPDGRLYMPTYPGGLVIAYDRETREYGEYPVIEEAHQLFAACVAEAGLIGVLDGLQHAVYALDPQTGRVSQKAPPGRVGRSGAFSRFLRHGDEFLLMLTAENAIELCRYSAEDLTWRG